MLEDKKVEDLLEQLRIRRQEVTTMKVTLTRINAEKEKWFTEKSKFQQQIKDRIGAVNQSKVRRNDLTTEVKELKVKRDSLNKSIVDAQTKVNALRQEYDELRKKLGIEEDPKRVLKQIEELEYMMQTEALSFDKEKALMKKVKELKKKANDAGGLAEKTKELDAARDAVRDLRRDANQYHRQVQEKANVSQEHHEHLLEDSQEIQDLKAKEEEAYQKFMEQKALFVEENTKLKAVLDAISAIRDQLDQSNVEYEREKEARTRKSLDQKEQEVKEKVRKVKKLTTEDLLILQAKGDESVFDTGFVNKKDLQKNSK
ncbi:MAG: hypothetical protein ABIH41_04555 [Nanoarchaeota archaeon]